MEKLAIKRTWWGYECSGSEFYTIEYESKDKLLDELLRLEVEAIDNKSSSFSFKNIDLEVQYNHSCGGEKYEVFTLDEFFKEHKIRE